MIEAPLVPVPATQFHGVTVNVWAPMVLGVVVNEKGGNETVLTIPLSIANTALIVSELACAVIV